MWKLILSSFTIHIIFLLAVFDIYFRTTISNVEESHVYSFKPPAKRLVLFVGDGLRAQSLYNYSFPKSNPVRDDLQANYIRQIISNDAPWGVSYSRVPTESRPGHVALLAGFYEDPSAITKGWKENPVDFDTVLNQTREAWCWGSPDIVPMFAKGTKHVHTYSYDTDKTEFGKNYTIELDDWVFNKVTRFFKSVTNDDEMKSRLQNGNIMFFLHLLGTDTAGHTFKPHSLEYIRNIETVDRGIKNIVELIENFYNHDNQTAYIFTSDHGMSNWGSHGAGHPHEIDCPIVAWGAGISLTSLHIQTIGNLYRTRTDVKQADIAVLLATLLGVGIPTNSIGILPDKFLNFTKYQLSEAYFTNVKQIISLYNAKRAEKIKLEYFKHFEQLTEQILDGRMKRIQNAIKREFYDSVINQCKELIELGLRGIQFYQNYYQTPILTAISLSIILWIVLLMEFVIRENVEYGMEKYVMKFQRRTNNNIWWLLQNETISFMFVLTTVTISSFLIYYFNLPMMCHIYFALPILLMQCVYLNFATWRNALKILNHQHGRQNQQLIFTCFFYIILIEALIQVFFHRWILSILILIIGIWNFIYTQQVFNINIFLMWFVSCGILAIFPLLPVIGHNSNIYILTCGGIIWLAVAFFLLQQNYLRNDKINLLIKRCQLTFILLSIVQSYLFRCNLIHDNYKGLMHAISWIISVSSILLPFFTRTSILERLLSIIFGLCVPFILLSVTYEPLFLITLSLHLLIWLRIESRMADMIRNTKTAKTNFTKSNRISDFHMINRLHFDESLTLNQKFSLNLISLQDFRHGFCNLFYLLLSFFGIGNIASINSFDPMWVVCFQTVFQPFLMTALILFKTIIIFLIVSCFLRAINIIAHISFQKLLLIILILSNIMILNFLYLVKNIGSWLEIGTSLSQYIIIEATAIIIIILYYVAVHYTSIAIRTNKYELIN